MLAHEPEHLFEPRRSFFYVPVGIRVLAIRGGDHQVYREPGRSPDKGFKGGHPVGRIHLCVVGEGRHWQKPAPSGIFACQVGAHDAVQRPVVALHKVGLRVVGWSGRFTDL